MSVYLSQMELAFKLNKIEALQLFKAVPKTAVKTDYFYSNPATAILFLPRTNRIA